MDTTHLVEQVRLYDGALFQKERVLSLYLNMKSLAWTYISSALRDTPEACSKALAQYSEWSDETSKSFVSTVSDLWPRTESDLQASIAIYKDLSGFTGHIAAHVQVATFLKIFFRHIVQHETVKQKTILDLSPIQLDFLFREFFRMSLYDSMVLFESPEPTKIEGGSLIPSSAVEPEVPESEPDVKPTETHRETEADEEERPTEALEERIKEVEASEPESVDQKLLDAFVSDLPTFTSLENTGALSMPESDYISQASEALHAAMNRVPERSVAGSVARGPTRSVVGSVVGANIGANIGGNIAAATNYAVPRASDTSSVASKASMVSKAMTALTHVSIRKPNVKTIVLQDDDARTKISRYSKR